MSKIVQIGSKTYEIPEQGDKAGWGEETTAWMEGVTDALSSVQGPNDILITSAALANNQTTAADIPGLLFNVAQVESVEITYTIKRIYNLGTTTVIESGVISGIYDGSEFFMDSSAIGEAGVTITVLNTGQFQYITSDLPDHTTSLIRFKAQTIDTP